MAENTSMTRAALLITDSFRNAVHGTSTFANFFVENFLRKTYTIVSVLEVETRKVYPISGQNHSIAGFNDIYVNASFSKSDFVIRKPEFKNWCSSLGIVINNDFKAILISHGWTKIKYRWNFYSIYYYLKNIFRARDLQRLSFYDEIIFISTVTDQFRHKDYFYAVKKGLSISEYDFSGMFIKSIQSKNFNGDTYKVDSGNYILVISNFEKVKNLWWLILYNLKRKIFNKQKKNFVVLIKPSTGILFKSFAFFSKALDVKLIHTQEKKYELLLGAEYLFIPSFTEYNPLVALEANACGKKVVSLFKITALKGEEYYKYLID